MADLLAPASSRTLFSLQRGRSPLAEIGEAKTPAREAALEGLRQRNACLDAFFYDVSRITPAEAQSIAPWFAREGALLVVPPSGQGPLRLATDLEHFAGLGGTEIRVLVVAGVGSSALGAAAFARNVADALAVPVAALVSGYGMSDALTEALGGFFWFGALNRLRHQFEQIDDLLRDDPGRGAGMSPAVFRTSLDTRVLCGLLADERFRFSLLAGHSKGNLVISEALYALDHGAARRLQDTWIVTVSATVAMPPRYRERIVDVMGEWDWFGAFNSIPVLGVELRPARAGHHTNTEISYHLPVTEVFRQLNASHGMLQ